MSFIKEWFAVFEDKIPEALLHPSPLRVVTLISYTIFALQIAFEMLVIYKESMAHLGLMLFTLAVLSMWSLVEIKFAARGDQSWQSGNLCKLVVAELLCTGLRALLLLITSWYYMANDERYNPLSQISTICFIAIYILLFVLINRVIIEKFAIQFTETIPSGIFIVKLLQNGKPSFVFMSQYFLKIFSLKPSRELINPFNVFKNVYPNDKAGFIRQKNQAFSELQPLYWEGRILSGEDLRWIILEAAPRRIEKDSVVWEGVVSDVTERKRMEDDMLRARHAAEQSEQVKSLFLANMSHEIRTPMNVITGLTSLLMESDLNAQQFGYLEKVQGASSILLNLINNILDFSKLEAGQLLIEKAAFQLSDVIHSTTDLFTYQLEKKGLRLITDVAADLPVYLLGDGLRLKQVLINLLGNAVKFTQQGEVRLLIAAVDGHARDARDISLRFCVSDTGIGIPAAYLDQLFAPFTQADTSITRTYGGSGLGLSITRRLVELMGGEITVTSSEGVGTSFCFTLSFERSEPKPDSSVTYLPPDTGASGAIALPQSGAEQRVQSEMSAMAATDRLALKLLLLELESLLRRNMLKALDVSARIDALLASSSLAADFQGVSHAVKSMQFKKAQAALQEFNRQLQDNEDAP